MTGASGLPFSIILEVIVCVFLGATLIYCAMLDKRLRAMRAGQDGMRDLVRDLNVATDRAVTAIDGLKKASAATNETLGGKVHDARELADELSLMIEAGNRIAERLEQNVRPATAQPTSRSTPVQSMVSAPRPAIQTAAGPRTTPIPQTSRDNALAARAAQQLFSALKRKG